MAYINGNKILSVVRTLYLSETERDLIARYNLGAYKSVEAINGITTITRQTGYVNLGVFDWQLHQSVAHLFTASLALTNASEPIDNNTIGDIICAIYKSATWNAVELANLQIAISIDGSLRIYDESCSTVNELIAKINGVILQYKLATSYTEQVIDGQPLITLDQKGSCWLRDEWEKTLNIWDEQWEIGDISGQTGENVPNSGMWRTFFIPVKPNTTYFLSNTNISSGQSNDVFFYDKSKDFINWVFGKQNTTFTTPNNCYYIRFYQSGQSSYTMGSIMVTDSDHAYPYQAYNGAILHEKDIAPVLLWENGNPTSDFVTTTLTISESALNYKYLIIAFKTYKTNTEIKYLKIGAINGTTTYEGTFYTSNELWNTARNITINNNLITLSVGIYNQEGTTGTSNAVAIPIAIYGTNVL